MGDICVMLSCFLRKGKLTSIQHTGRRDPNVPVSQAEALGAETHRGFPLSLAFSRQVPSDPLQPVNCITQASLFFILTGTFYLSIPDVFQL